MALPRPTLATLLTVVPVLLLCAVPIAALQAGAAAPAPVAATATATATAAAAPPAPSAAMSAQDIVASSVEASGGAALDAVRSVRRHADFHIDSPLFGVLDGDWEVAFVPGKKAFHEADLEVSVTATGWNGTVGWEEGPMGLRDITPEEIAVNRPYWELSVLHGLARDGAADALARLADESIADVAHYVLEHTDERGAKTRIYVHPATFLISRITTSIEIPQLGRSAVTADYADYAEVQGVMLPQTSSQTIENLWVSKTSYTATEINPELPDSLFERPKS